MASMFSRAELLQAWLAHLPHSSLGWALSWAARAGSLSSVRLLIAARAESDRRMENGVGMPLRWAAGASEDASLPVVQALLAANASVNYNPEATGTYAVMCATMQLAFFCGLRSELCLVLANGRGITPLHYATGLNPNPDIVGLLLDSRADANAKTALGMSPLEFARVLSGGAVPIEVVKAFAGRGLLGEDPTCT